MKRLSRVSRALTVALTASIVSAACATDAIEEEPTEGADGKADQISGRDDPSGLLGSAERKLAKLVTAGEVGQSFGVPREDTPYPDTYWPMVDDGIAVEWLEADGTRCDSENNCDDPQPSPLAKLVAMTAPSSLEDAKNWEVKNHGSEVANVKDWFGHCPGWVATALLNKPVTAPVFVKGNALGLEECASGEAGCTKFEIGDINALGAEAHEGVRSSFIGARCDVEPADIKRDEFGRIIRDGSGCKGLNAGAMVILVGNRLKVDHKPFAIDAQNEFNTEQIWNQPAFRYTVNKYQELSESEAANLVATGGESKTGSQNDYLWNDNARGFVLIDFTLHWVTETSGPNLTAVNGADSSNRTRMVAVIELDSAPTDADAEVIGGEYLDDESVGANRLAVQPFAWIAHSPRQNRRNNPFVKVELVQQLLDIAASDGGSGGGADCAHDPQAIGVALDGSCESCVASICAADSFCCNTEWDNLCVQAAEAADCKDN